MSEKSLNAIECFFDLISVFEDLTMTLCHRFYIEAYSHIFRSIKKKPKNIFLSLISFTAFSKDFNKKGIFILKKFVNKRNDSSINSLDCSALFVRFFRSLIFLLMHRHSIVVPCRGAVNLKRTLWLYFQYGIRVPWFWFLWKFATHVIETRKAMWEQHATTAAATTTTYGKNIFYRKSNFLSLLLQLLQFNCYCSASVW